MTTPPDRLEPRPSSLRSDTEEPAESPPRHHAPLASALLYAALAVAWIVLSDLALLAIAPRVATYAAAQTFKGIGFVALTTLLLYLLVRGEQRAFRILLDRHRQRQHMFEHSLAVQVVFDPDDGRLLDVNRAAERFYGYDRGTLRGMTIFDLNTLPREEVRPLLDRFRAAQLNVAEFTHRLASGETRDVEILSSPVEMDGRVVLYSIVHDISARRQAEAALHESERRFRAIFDQSFQITALLEPDGRLIEANATGLDFAGLPRSEAVGRPLWDLPWLPASEAGSVRQAIAEAADGRLARRQAELRGRGGEQITVDLSIKPVLDEHGKTALLVAEARDVSDLRRALRSVREASEMLEAVVQASPQPIITLDRGGGIRMWNPAAAETFGWTSTEVLGLPYPMIAPDSMAAFNTLVERALAGQSIGGAELTGRRRDGSTFPLSLSVAPLSTDERHIDGVVVLAADITEKLRAERLQSALYRIARLSDDAEDMQGFYAAIHDVVRGLLIADNFYLALRGDGGNDHLYFPYFVDETEPAPTGPEPISGLTGYVLRTGQPLLISEDEVRAMADRGEVELVGTPTVDWLGVPLKHGEDVFGVLAVQSYSPAVRFSERDLSLMVFVSSHIAGALQRKQAAEALRQSEERYRLLVETSPDAVIYTDTLLNIVFASGRAAHLYGADSAAGLPGPSLLDLVAPEDRLRIAADTRVLLDSPDVARAQYTLVRADGTCFPAHANTSLTTDADNRPTGFIFVLEDITDRIQAEEAEREQRALAEALRNATAALNSTLNLEELLSRILDSVAAVVPHDASNIMLIEGEISRVARWRGKLPAGATWDDVHMPLALADAPNLQQMVETLQPYIINDVQNYPGWAPNPASDWVRACLGAPIAIKGQVVGFLNLDSRQPGFFTEGHARWLQAFADQAAVALNNARLYESERRQLALAHTLTEVGSLLTAGQPLSEVLEHIFDLLASVLKYDSVSVHLLEPDGSVRMVAGRGHPHPAMAAALTREHLEAPFRERDVFITEDARALPGWIEHSEEPPVRSRISAALRVHGQLIGALNVNSLQPGRYNDSLADTVRAFASQAAIAIENARLAESERHERQAAELMRDAAAAVASTLDPDQVMLEMACHLRAISGFDVCMVYEWEPGAEAVRMLAEHSRIMWNRPDTSFPYPLDQYPATRRLLHEGGMVYTRIDDPEADPGEVSFLKTKGLAEMVVLPLRSGEQIIGIAELGGTGPLPPPDEIADRCGAVLDEAAGWLPDSLWAVEAPRLFELAMALRAEIGAPWASLSAWDTEGDATRALIEASDLIWSSGQGPAYPLSRWPAMQRVLENQRFEVVTRDGPQAGPLDHQRLDMWDLSAMVLQPMILRGETIGLIQLDRRAQGPITEADVRRWQAAVDQAAVALENARLYHQSQERNQRLALLNEIARRGTESSDPDTLLDTLADIAGRIVDSDACYLTLWDPFSHQVLPRAAFGPGSEIYRLRPPAPPERRTLTASVLKAGHPLMIEDVWDTPYAELDRTRDAEYTAIVSGLALPLQAGGRDLGALLLGFFKHRRLTDEEIRWAMQAAEVIALAIAKAQAYADLEERVADRTAQLTQANQRLMMLTRLKDEFVANVSHELRTPITNIKLHHHLLAARPDRFDIYMERLVRETARLEYIINDLLRLSEMDQGEMKVNLAPTDLNSLTRLLATDRLQMAQEQGLTLNVEMADDLPLVQADQMLIGQALSILLTNALNYTPRGGSITIRTQVMPLINERWAIISVADTGIGIPLDEQSRLFTRFFRGAAARASDIAGTGLGLSIAREIVERHHGRIEMLSEGVPGLGSTFTIWLPIDGEADQPSSTS